MDTHEKIEACERKKGDGNFLFKAGKFWRASEKYDKVRYQLNQSKEKLLKLQFVADKPLEIEISSQLHFQAAKYVEFDHTFTDEEQSVAKTLWLSCNLNNAACKLKQAQYVEASRLCTKVFFCSEAY